jgi:hypothetical protein
MLGYFKMYAVVILMFIKVNSFFGTIKTFSIEGKSILWKHLFEKGISFVHDLLDLFLVS